MNTLAKIAATALASLAFSACVEEQSIAGSSSAMPRDASGAAETACMTAVNSNYGGNVRELRVVSSEFSQANSMVMLDAVGVRGGSQTERWRCLTSEAGEIAELTVVQ
jgi:hypothetical protein